jgi:tyrosine-protein kinase
MTTEFGSQPTLRTYLAVLRQQRWWVICVALLGLGAGIAASVTQPKQYSASAQVLAQSTENFTTIGVAQQPITPTDVQTELQLVTSAPVRRAVQRRLGSAPAVSTAQVAQTNVIEITATSTSPAWSARVANAYARAFVTYERTVSTDNLTAVENQLQSQITSISRQIRSLHAKSTLPQVSALLNQEAVLKEQLAQMEVSAAVTTGGVALVTPAQPPLSPSSPGPLQDAALGLTAGLLAGLAIAFLRDNLNDALTSKEAVEHLGGAPVLSLVPLVTSWKKRDRAVVVSVSEPTSPAAEAYRSLRTSLQFARQERELRTLLVTSPMAAEGKTSTLTNLGTVFAQAGERVVLVSCDLRRPRVGQFFGLAEEAGLTTVMLGQHTLEQVLQPIPSQRNLWALTAGTLPHNPAELLNGPSAQQIFAALRAKFDLVLVDSPPLLPVTDAAVLSKTADATLLVVAAGQTKRGDLRRAAEKLAQVNAPVIGIVLNQVTKQVGYGYGYGYGYGSGYKPYPAAATGQNSAANGNGKVTSASITDQ